MNDPSGCVYGVQVALLALPISDMLDKHSGDVGMFAPPGRYADHDKGDQRPDLRESVQLILGKPLDEHWFLGTDRSRQA